MQSRLINTIPLPINPTRPHRLSEPILLRERDGAAFSVCQNAPAHGGCCVAVGVEVWVLLLLLLRWRSKCALGGFGGFGEGGRGRGREWKRGRRRWWFRDWSWFQLNSVNALKQSVNGTRTIENAMRKDTPSSSWSGKSCKLVPTWSFSSPASLLWCAPSLMLASRSHSWKRVAS